jgi:(1->4)-alpha-D-glucan 1-alpha-D-glucosylmutase
VLNLVVTLKLKRIQKKFHAFSRSSDASNGTLFIDEGNLCASYYGRLIRALHHLMLTGNVGMETQEQIVQNDNHGQEAPAIATRHSESIRSIPAATYRVQLNNDFTLQQLQEVIQYLDALGVSTIYAAPVLKSRKGSTHGYDVVDPHVIDPEIGTIKDLEQLSTQLKQMSIGWLQDIVPNHMAFDIQNERLMDVLERGDQSPFYNYFDIDWNHHSPELKGKLAVPFLGKELEQCLADGELTLSFSGRGFTISYFDSLYPLSVSAFHLLKGHGEMLDEKIDSYIEVAGQLSLDEWKTFKKMWVQACHEGACNAVINKIVTDINDDRRELKTLLERQNYLLMYWQKSERQINYRRFFTVNELICLRMEDQKVFEDYHTFIDSLYRNGLINGVRIDHIDGLYDPSVYVNRLRSLLGENCYIIAEKILEAKEAIPKDWPLEGTSGYEFLSYVSQLFTDRAGAQKLVAFYRTLIPEVIPYSKLVFNNKKLILENYMAGEWDNLLHYFVDLKLDGDFDVERLKQALALFMISVPVYRIYPDVLPLKENDLDIIEEAFRKALANGSDYKDEIEYLRSLFTNEAADAEEAERRLRFLKRLMQFTGPLTAKGVEDTTFYVYNPLISHDEVGDAPSTLGISVQAFHSRMLLRQRSTPYSLNATATHDTKRGEDARLRLNVLSEIPEIWEKYVRQWFDENKNFRVTIGDRTAPSVNDEYFIYQSLLGGFPHTMEVTEEFLNRFNEYLVKAIREAKVNSNWTQPDADYEQACKRFVELLINPDHPFMRSFKPLIEMITRYANLYALGQALIKVTAPGIPDVYQGSELWDLSFVDPDNRRAVDYDLRRSYLEQLIAKEKEGAMSLMHFLKTRRNDGFEKLFVIWKSLNFRRENPEIFEHGDYIPLDVSGKETVLIAYARKWNDRWLIVAVPLALAKYREQDQPYASNPDDLKYIGLPQGAPACWRNIFTGERLEISDRVPVFEAFKDFPVALFTNC